MKILKCLIVSFCLAGVWESDAEDIRLNDGTVLKNIEVIGSGIDFIRVSHEDGIVSLESKELPLNLQIRWDMKPEQVEKRKKMLAERARRIREREVLRAKQIRDSLSEAQKIPRYIERSELNGLLLRETDLSPLEIQYFMLKWNESEADRVGLLEQKITFAKQLQDLFPRLQVLYAEKKRQNKEWVDITEKVQQIENLSTDQIRQLKKQVSDLKGELDKAIPKGGLHQINTQLASPPLEDEKK